MPCAADLARSECAIRAKRVRVIPERRALNTVASVVGIRSAHGSARGLNRVYAEAQRRKNRRARRCVLESLVKLERSSSEAHVRDGGLNHRANIRFQPSIDLNSLNRAHRTL